jgi:lia operon protein LiaG
MAKWIVGIAIVIFLVGIGGIAVQLVTDSNFTLENFAGETVTIDEQELIDAERIERIIVKTGSTNVRVTPIEGKQIKVLFQGKASKKIADNTDLTVTQDENNLNLQVERSASLGFYQFIKADLEIKLPKKLFDKIEVNTSSGDIDVNGIETGMTQLIASSGDITVENLQSQLVALEVSSGIIDASQLLGKVRVKASSGDVELSLTEIKEDVTIETSSGDASISFTTMPKSLGLKFETSSGEGNVVIDMDNLKESEDSISGTIGNGKPLLNVKTSSGDFMLTE